MDFDFVFLPSFSLIFVSDLIIHISPNEANNSSYMNRDKGSNSYYALSYQYLCLVNDQNPVLVDDIKEELIDINKRLAKSIEIQIREQHIDSSYEFILFESSPKKQLSKLVNSLKTLSSRMLFKRFPELKESLNGKLWANQYIITTYGFYEESELLKVAREDMNKSKKVSASLSD